MVSSAKKLYSENLNRLEKPKFPFGLATHLSPFYSEVRYANPIQVMNA